MAMIMPIVFFLFFKVWSPLCYKRNIKRTLSFAHHGEAAYFKQHSHVCTWHVSISPCGTDLSYIPFPAHRPSNCRSGLQ